jgi:aminoglycoside phosphotransferase (APT) family kinase protein
MQPEPLTYLMAIRRELQSPDLFGEGLESGASPVIAHRAGEGLAHLALRVTALPALLERMLPAFQDIARDVADLCTRYAVEMPAALREANATRGALAGRDGGAIALYDRLEAGLAVGMRALAAGAGSNPALAQAVQVLCVRLAEIEADKHLQYAEAFAKLVAPPPAVGEEIAIAPPSEEGLTALLRARLAHAPQARARNIQRLAGFNSKEIFWVDIEDCADWPVRSVIRREPAYNVTGAAVADEWELLDQLRRHHVPVPRVLLGERASGTSPGLIITERLAGTPQTHTTLGPNGRGILLELARIAARVHQVKLAHGLAPLTARGQNARQRTLEAIDRFYSRWAQMRCEDSAVIEAGYHWLRSNVNCVRDHVGLVHGDFNLRNVLIDGDRVSAVLDWELSHAGDGAEDLAHLRPDLEHTVDWEEFLAEYNAHSEYPVSNRSVDYFLVYVAFWQAVLASVAFAGPLLGKCRNFIFASVGFTEYRFNCDLLAQRMAKFARSPNDRKS